MDNDQRKAKKRALLAEVKDLNPCQVCGEVVPVCLDLHHLDPDTKESSIAAMVAMWTSVAAFRAELSKCACLCSNCHRKYHAGYLPDIQLKPVILPPMPAKSKYSVKLTEALVIELRQDWLEGYTYTALATMYGISVATAWNAIRGGRWSHVPMPIGKRPRHRGWRR